MKPFSKRLISFIIAFVFVFSTLAVYVSAAVYTFSRNTANSILNEISTKYSAELADSIADLLYDSDYSDFLNQSETLRSYETLGSKKAWPITNADPHGTTVYDRGTAVNWGAGAKGCFAYASFFTKSVYGTRGARQPDDQWLTLNSSSSTQIQDLKNFLLRYAQPGEHLRINNKHSVVYLGQGTKDGRDGFYIAEYWGGGAYNSSTDRWSWNPSNDQFFIRFYTYENFTSKYNGRQIYMYNAYETSDYYDDENPSPVIPITKKTRDIVLVLDVSGSMSGSRITNTKSAAKTFVTDVLSKSSTTRIALVTFDTNVHTLSALSTDAAGLCSLIDSVSATGSTNMHGGLQTASDILDTSNADKKAIVIMGDGAPCAGLSSSSGTVVVDDGTSVSFGSYLMPVYNIAEEIKNVKGYTIYSFGFGLSASSTEYKLMKYIASRNTTGVGTSDRYFWENTDVSQIVFVLSDIDDVITSRRNIIITIECPVDASVALEDEVLDSDHLTASFGSLSYTQKAANDYKYVFTLNDEYADAYDIVVKSTGTGTMDMTVRYNEGDDTQYRSFVDVPLKADTVITTSTPDSRADFILYVDDNGDEDFESVWDATIDESAVKPSEDEYTQLNPNEFVEYTENGTDADEEPLFTVESVTARPDSTVTVYISMIEPANVKSIMFEDFQYDHNALGLVNAGWAISGVMADANETDAVIALLDNTVLSGDIFYFTFDVFDNAPDGDYTVTCHARAKVMDGKVEKDIPSGVEAGTITVSSYTRGDVNNDGDVNSNDAIYLLRHTMNAGRYPINQPGDMNGDDNTNSNDAIYLLRHTMNGDRYPLWDPVARQFMNK